MTYKAKQLADKAGVHVETLRYYERQGLLLEPSRSDAGYRQYTNEHIEVLIFIKRLKGIGFSLKEIKTLLSLKSHPGESAAAAKALAQDKIKHISQQLIDLEHTKLELQALIDACPGEIGTNEHCPILHESIKPTKGGEQLC